MGAGEGMLFYLYSDDDANTAGDNGFPKYLNSPNSQFEIAPNVSQNSGTITMASSLGDGDFELVGNPFDDDIDWDAASGWTKTNMSNVIYIWSDAANNWLTWNGSSGTNGKSDGQISALQGFFVQASGGSGDLSATSDVVSGSGTFYKESQSPLYVGLELTHDGLTKEIKIGFHNEGQTKHERFDALALQSLNATHLQLFTHSEDGQPLSINVLPNLSDQYRLPVHIAYVDNGQMTSTELSLSATSLDQLPEDWSIELYDTEMQLYTDLRSGAIVVRGEERAQKIAPLEMPEPRMQQVSDDVRYGLVITPGETTSIGDKEDGMGVQHPNHVELKQNYPNPFNPTTTIQFGLPVNADVELAIFNMLGQQVGVLHQGQLSAGFHNMTWNASDQSSGIFFYRLTVDGKIAAYKKMTLIK